MFQPFYRCRVERCSINRTGVGLSVIRDRITAPGRRIEFENEVGTGISFSIELPPAVFTQAAGAVNDYAPWFSIATMV